MAESTFPTLSVKQLVEAFLDELPDLLIKEEDINKPTKAIWHKNFFYILAKMMNLTPEELDASFWPLQEVLPDYPDLYEEGIAMIKLVKHMQLALEACDIHDFSLNDIIFPTKKRLVRILSGIMNFLRFCNARHPEYLDIVARRKQQQEKLVILKKANDDLVRRVNELTSKKAEQEEACKSVKHEIAQCTSQMEQVTNNINISNKNASDVRTRTNEQRVAMAKRAERIESLKDKMVTLDSAIVPSPERCQREIKEMKEKLSQLDISIKEKEMKQRGLRAAIGLGRAKEAEQHLKQLTSLHEIHVKDQKLKEALSAVKEEQQTQRANIEGAKNNLQALQRLHANKQEKLDKVVMQLKYKEETLKGQLELLQTNYAKINEDNEEVRSIEEERQRLQERYAAMETQHKKSMASGQEDYESLLKDFQSYNDRLAHAWSNGISKPHAEGEFGEK